MHVASTYLYPKSASKRCSADPFRPLRVTQPPRAPMTRLPVSLSIWSDKTCRGLCRNLEKPSSFYTPQVHKWGYDPWVSINGDMTKNVRVSWPVENITLKKRERFHKTKLYMLACRIWLLHRNHHWAASVKRNVFLVARVVTHYHPFSSS